MSTGTELSNETYYTKTCQQGEIVAMHGPSRATQMVSQKRSENLDIFTSLANLSQ